MTNDSPPDAAQKRRQVWDDAAPGWKRHWKVFERSAQIVSERLIELANIRPGSRVLDVATGIGEPAISAARLVGPSGWVTAADYSPAMLKIARERANSLGLRNIEFVQADAQSLTLAPEQYDAATCRWGLMFVPDLAEAMRRIFQSLKPGGRFATAVWGAREKVPMISLAGEEFARLAGQPAQAPGAPDPCSLADIAMLERVLADAGFAAMRHERIPVVFTFESADEFIQFRHEVSPSHQAIFSCQPPTVRDEIVRAMRAAVKRYESGEVIKLVNECICAAAARPS